MGTSGRCLLSLDSSHDHLRRLNIRTVRRVGNDLKEPCGLETTSRVDLRSVGATREFARVEFWRTFSQAGKEMTHVYRSRLSLLISHHILERSCHLLTKFVINGWKRYCRRSLLGGWFRRSLGSLGLLGGCGRLGGRRLRDLPLGRYRFRNCGCRCCRFRSSRLRRWSRLQL